MNPVRSAVPEIRWPSLPTPKGASLLATELRLNYGESISPDARLALQWSQLAALIRHAREHVSYYKNDLAAFEKVDGKLQDWATWEGVPLLTQSRMLEAEENVISTFVPEAHGKVVTTLNPSAGGRLLELKDTEINQHIARAIHLREHRWYQRNFRAKFAIIDESPRVKSNFGTSVLGWGIGLDSALDVSVAPVLHVETALAQQIKWLTNNKVEILTTNTTNLENLVEHCAQTGAKLPLLREVRVVGSMWADALPRRCFDVWGIVIAQHVSLRAVGPIALQCPESKQMHVQAENVLVEIVDEAGQACAAGDVGHLVVTTLHNFASPLFRYDTGQRASLTGPCACGRTLQTICFVNN